MSTIPVLYYRDPEDDSWKPFATTDVIVANEVEIAYDEPPIERPHGFEIWIDPNSNDGTGDGWEVFDKRYVKVPGDTMTGPLTLPPQPVPFEPLHATPKWYVDDAIDAAISALEPFPVGMITMYGGNTAPPGWHLCNGTPHGSAALQAVLGSPNAPDLRDRFIVGAGNSYAKGATGGAATVALSAAESGLRDHGHTASSGTVSSDHSHGVGAIGVGTTAADTAHAHWNPSTPRGFGGGGHEHGIDVYEGLWKEDIDGQFLDTVRDGQTPGWKAINARTNGGGGHEHAVDVGNYATNPAGGGHAHSLTVPAHNTGGISANHTHSVTVNASGAANAAAAHENRPPYYALVFIIKK